MRPKIPEILAAAGFSSLLAFAFAMLVTESPLRAAVVVALVWVSLWLQLILHECGHLGMALLLRVPVVEVNMGRKFAVSLRPDPDGTALPARMVLTYLGGPFANLAAAVVLFAVVGGPPIVQATLIETAVVAGLFGVANLVPDGRSDGKQLLVWLRASKAVIAGLRAVYFQEKVSRLVRDVAQGAVDDKFIEMCNLAVLKADDQVVVEAERLRKSAFADDTDPVVAARIAQALTIQFGMWYAYAAVVKRRPVAHNEVVELDDLARLASEKAPGTEGSRLATGLADLLNERPTQDMPILLREILESDQIPPMFTRSDEHRTDAYGEEANVPKFPNRDTPETLVKSVPCGVVQSVDGQPAGPVSGLPPGGRG